jgi:hypothetical protein
MTLIFRVGFLLFFIWLQEYSLIVYSSLSILVLLAAFFINRGNDQKLSFFIALFDSILFTLLTTLFFGWKSGFYLIFFELMLLVFVNSELRQGSKLLLGSFLSLLLISLFFFYYDKSLLNLRTIYRWQFSLLSI